MHDDDTIYPPKEAAPLLHPDLKPRTLERWRQNGTGPQFVRVGRRVGYTGAAIKAYHAQQTRQHTAETKDFANHASRPRTDTRGRR